MSGCTWTEIYGSVYNLAMSPPPLPLTAVPWSADLASALADTSAAIARLDARIYASSLAPAWTGSGERMFENVR